MNSTILEALASTLSLAVISISELFVFLFGIESFLNAHMHFPQWLDLGAKAAIVALSLYAGYKLGRHVWMVERKRT